MIGIVFIGAPCSGKSTIARDVSMTLGVTYISSGDLARRMAVDDNVIRQQLNEGWMAPESKMRDAIYRCISGCISAGESAFILDGFPRFIEQYEWLINTFVDMKFICINVQASIQTIYSRHTLRGRSDDNNIVLMQRVQRHIDDTLPIVKMFGIVHDVDNDGDDLGYVIDTVCDIIKEELDANDSEI